MHTASVYLFLCVCVCVWGGGTAHKVSSIWQEVIFTQETNKQNTTKDTKLNFSPFIFRASVM